MSSSSQPCSQTKPTQLLPQLAILMHTTALQNNHLHPAPPAKPSPSQLHFMTLKARTAHFNIFQPESCSPTRVGKQTSCHRQVWPNIGSGEKFPATMEPDTFTFLYLK